MFQIGAFIYLDHDDTPLHSANTSTRTDVEDELQDFNFDAITKDDVEEKILSDDASSPGGKEN